MQSFQKLQTVYPKDALQFSNSVLVFLQSSKVCKILQKFHAVPHSSHGAFAHDSQQSATVTYKFLIISLQSFKASRAPHQCTSYPTVLQISQNLPKIPQSLPQFSRGPVMFFHDGLQSKDLLQSFTVFKNWPVSLTITHNNPQFPIDEHSSPQFPRCPLYSSTMAYSLSQSPKICLPPPTIPHSQPQFHTVLHRPLQWPAVKHSCLYFPTVSQNYAASPHSSAKSSTISHSHLTVPYSPQQSLIVPQSCSTILQSPYNPSETPAMARSESPSHIAPHLPRHSLQVLPCTLLQYHTISNNL